MNSTSRNAEQEAPFAAVEQLRQITADFWEIARAWYVYRTLYVTVGNRTPAGQRAAGDFLYISEVAILQFVVVGIVKLTENTGKKPSYANLAIDRVLRAYGYVQKDPRAGPLCKAKKVLDRAAKELDKHRNEYMAHNGLAAAKKRASGGRNPSVPLGLVQSAIDAFDTVVMEVSELTNAEFFRFTDVHDLSARLIVGRLLDALAVPPEERPARIELRSLPSASVSRRSPPAPVATAHAESSK